MVETFLGDNHHDLSYGRSLLSSLARSSLR